jgi:N-acetylmuramoyl-L-alanine amidase
MAQKRSTERLVVVVALVLGACGGSHASSAGTTTTTVPTVSTAPASTTTTTVGPTTTTTTPKPPSIVPGVHVDWAPIDPNGPAKAVVTPTGIVLPVVSQSGDRYVVTTPCSNQATVTGTPLAGANVVIDPGHGGEESGAVGPTGLTEKEVNLAIALDVKAILESQGATVVLTRTADYRITLLTRGAIATALAPQAFVSIHHNAEPDGPFNGPGNETYYQIASADSKRLAGLVWEEVHTAFSTYKVAWEADTDAGAKYRLASAGGDYYGILKRTAGVAAVLSEAAFITDAPEEQLLRQDDFRQAEALAISRAVVRFLGTPDPGSGYTTPYPRTEPAGSGGGSTGCEDPALE